MDGEAGADFGCLSPGGDGGAEAGGPAVGDGQAEADADGADSGLAVEEGAAFEGDVDVVLGEAGAAATDLQEGAGAVRP
ncbi:hypothetical protein ACFWOB_37170 [Streptomyces sp. NPDC058420]|uniref:hypothetical protein n=1 Tax=Streptomyces sp. NPDC058420 TaxID=3346489 RepID=UPI00365F452D